MKALRTSVLGRCVVTSKIIESLRGDLTALHKAGVIDKQSLDIVITMPKNDKTAVTAARKCQWQSKATSSAALS